jgi:type II secretory pathway component GspD/PulD (secretin)/beta-lactamase regulating signal transducer with metallopeptidase domain
MISGIPLVDLVFWTLIWQSTLFLSVGLFLSFLLRCRSARAHRLLLLSIIASMLVPAMAVLVRHFGLGIFEAGSVEVQAQVTEPEPENISEPFVISPTEMFLQPQHLVQNTPLIEPAEERIIELSVFDTFFRQNWRLILLFGWLGLSFILTARLLVTFLLGIRLLKKAEPLDCERVTKALIHAKAKLGIHRKVRIFGSRCIKSPVIWCWRRKPVLLVPKDAGHYHERIDWTGILCHELAHWKRRDHISGLIAEFAACIIPWQLLLWWAKTRMINLSENACDDWVIATGKTSADYAESLLDLTPGGQMAFVPAVVRDKNELARRIRRILKDSCGNPRTGLLWAATAFIIACSIAVTVAFAQTRTARAESANETSNKETTATSEDKSLSNSGLQWQIFEIRNRDPNEMVGILKVILKNQMAKNPSLQSEKEQIILIPLPEKNWIIAKAPAEAMELITEWITKLDSGYEPNKLKDLSLLDENEIVEKFFYLNHGSPSQAAKKIEPLLSDKGYVSAEENAGTLLVIDKVSVLLEIEKLIEKLDVPDVPADDSLEKIQDNDTVVSKIFKLKNYSPSKMGQIIYPLLDSSGYLTADDSTKTLMITDTAKTLMRIELIIKQFDESAKTSATELFQLKYTMSNRMADILNQIIKLGIIQLSSKNTVIVPDPRSNILIVRASPENMKMIKDLTAIIDQPVESQLSNQPTSTSYFFGLKDGDSERFTKLLKIVFGDKVDMKIIAADSRKALSITASQSYSQQIGKLVEWYLNTATNQNISVPEGESDQIGPPPDEFIIDTSKNSQLVQSSDYETIQLQNIDTVEAAEYLKMIITKLYPDSGDRMAIQPLPQSHQIIVFADKQIRQTARNLIQQIDKPSQPVDYDTIAVRYIDVDEAAKTLIKILGQMSPDFQRNISIQPLAQSRQLLVFGKKQYREMVKKLVSEIDLSSNRLITKIYKLQYAKSEEVKSKLDVLFNNGIAPEGQGGRALSGNKIIIVTYPSLNQIIVSASEEKMEEIEKLIIEWDTPALVDPK